MLFRCGACADVLKLLLCDDCNICLWLVTVLKTFVFKNTFFISLRVDKLMKCSRFKGLQHHRDCFFFFSSKVATQRVVAQRTLNVITVVFSHVLGIKK